MYVCWAQFVGNAGNNGVFFSRSTDGGQTYSQPQKISEGVHDSQFCDIGVTSVGTVYVTWRSFEGRGSTQVNGVVVAKSTDGGATFTKPQVITEFIPWDVGDKRACRRKNASRRWKKLASRVTGSSALNAKEEPRRATPTRDCGDGPFVCESGYVFFREDSQTRITADPTDTAHPQAAYIVYNATVPGSETPTGTSYGTVEPGIGSQGQLYFIRTLNGSSWSTPHTDDAGAGERGTSSSRTSTQTAADCTSSGRTAGTTPQRGRPAPRAGGDYRTVPIANQWVAHEPARKPLGWSRYRGRDVTTRFRRICES